VFILVFLQVFCQRTAVHSEGPLRITTTIYPIFDMVRNLTAKGDSVEFLIPPRANPHTYEPSPSVLQRLRQADFLIGIAPGFDGWPAEYSAENLKIIWLADKIGLNGHEGHNHGKAGRTHDHTHSINPHIWLSISMAEKICRVISFELAEINPHKAGEYETRLDAYIQELAALHEKCRELFQSAEYRSFFQWHSAWEFFAEDYGLTIAGTLTQGHGDEPPLRHFTNMVNKARKMETSVLVAEQHMENKTLDTFTRETGARIVRLDAIGDPEDPSFSTYLNLMWTNAGMLRKAMSGKQEKNGF